MSVERIQNRRGTSEQWLLRNPILGSGEIGFEVNTGKFKMGDGTSTWSQLSYFETSDGIDVDLSNYYTKSQTDTNIGTAIAALVDSAPSTLDTLNEIATALGDDPNFATTIIAELGNKAESDHTHTISEITDYEEQDISNKIELTSLSAQNSGTPSGSGSLSYNNTNGSFTYTPPVIPAATPAASPTVRGTVFGRTDSNGSIPTSLGHNALVADQNGTSFFAGNIGVGNSAGLSNTTGHNNIFVGQSAGSANTTGIKNVLIGTQTMTRNMTGSDNVAIGFAAGFLQSFVSQIGRASCRERV
jgi:hypothetical protein